MQQREEASAKERVGKLKASVICKNCLTKTTMFSSSVITTLFQNNPQCISLVASSTDIFIIPCALFCDEKMKICADAK